MNCPICGNHADPLPKTFDSEGFQCKACGDYGISDTLLKTGWESLGQSQRRQALESAKRQAEPGKLPKITTYTV
jgi:hypothetical protein